jgi:hypothetical protein
MKSLTIILCTLAALIACAPLCSAASTVAATDPQAAAALVYVSGYEIEPATFYPYETGTVTVKVTNGANASVVVDMPNLIESHVHVKNLETFNTRTTIGPGATVSFPFIITVDPPDGTYNAVFTVSPMVYGSSVKSFIPIKVDSTDIRTSISEKPDVFSVNKKATVNVTVVNPRDGQIDNVLVKGSSSGAEIFPQEKYIGSIAANSKAETSFQITPHNQGDVIFNVTFDNGDDHRQTSVVLPLNIGEDKTAVVPVLNDISLTEGAGYYTLTGDVSNAGVTNAQGMILSIGSPAQATDPYPEYPIGSLNSNDFSSFTLTFTSPDLSTVPVKIQWKDSDGNTFSATKTLDLHNSAGSNSVRSGSSSGSSASGSSTSTRAAGGPGGGGMFSFGGSRSAGLSAFYPLIAGGIILIVAIILWKKRKAIVTRFRKQ